MGNDSAFSCSAAPGCFPKRIDMAFEVFIYLMYGAVFVFSFFGNAIVAHVVFSSPRMRTVTNLFIVNLTLGGIFMTCFCIPFSFVPVLILQYWPFPEVLCPTFSYCQAVSVMVSAYTLIVLSYDRYVAIIHPLRPRMSHFKANVLIACVWTFAMLTALPIAFVSKVVRADEAPSPGRCVKCICMEQWDEVQLSYIYSILLLVLQYFLPTFILIVTYSRIAIKALSKRFPGDSGNYWVHKIPRSKKKMVKTTVSVVLAFTGCWLPFHILMIVGDMHPRIWEWPHINYIWFAVHWLAMSHTCYNSVIYCWMDARFRNGLHSVIEKVTCRRKESSAAEI